jgi:hypothetical protein
MALFTDSGLINISDLEVYESTLSKVASTHNINIGSKTAITLAAIGDRLLMRLVHAGGANGSGYYSGLTSTRTIASLPPQNRWLFDLDNVVVTDTLKRWICYEILAQVFSEAYNVQMNDRFKQKWADYAARAQETESSTYTLGIPVAYRPLAQPALAQVATGTGTLPAGIITVQTTWVNAFGNEGAPSLLVPVTLPSASSFSVTIMPAQNNPPNTAVGWNVYVGANGNAPARQNSTTLPLNMLWTVPASGLVQGVAPTNGQQPDCFALDSQRTLRG